MQPKRHVSMSELPIRHKFRVVHTKSALMLNAGLFNPISYCCFKDVNFYI